MKRLSLFVLVATMFVACATDATQDLAPEIPTAPDELQVSFDEEDTRIQLGENGRPVWTEGDLVSVFYRSNANSKYQFVGETGDANGSIKLVEEGVATQQTTQIVAVYPYSEDYWFNWNTGDVEAFLSAEQTYLKDSFGVGSSIMVSKSDYKQLSFKNVCGWIKLQFTGSGSISKIVLRGNDGEQVAGEIYINTQNATCALASDMGESGEDSMGGNIITDNTILTSVTLNCGDGVALNSETPTAFYVALPPQTFEKGLTLEITDNTDFTMSQSTENSITIERNHILPMATLLFVNSNTPATPNPATNEIWYTSSDGNVVEPYKTDVFGANITSNTYENGVGVITFDGDVTTIGVYAFRGCSSLTSVTIPDSVTTIEFLAFEYCDALKAFYGKFASEDNRCLIVNGVLNSFAPAGLTTYSIPDSVTEIRFCAFEDCDALTSVTIPDSVTTIGGEAFRDCDTLTSVTIPDSVTTIGYEAFRDCDALTSVTILDSVTTIGDWAFGHCSALKAFYGKYASADNRCLIVNGVLNSFAPAGLTTYSIPNSVTTIGNWVFAYCDALTSVTIPDSVTKIGDYAFCDCSALTSVTIGNSVTTIGNYAFQSCSALKAFYGKFASADNRCLIVDGVLNSFAPAELTTYSIPDSVTKIGDWAFRDCDALTSVTIPDSVTTIGGYAFRDCSALTSVTIPDSVTKIGSYAFKDCSALKEVYCEPTTPPSLGNSSVFDNNSSDRKIYVPTASVSAYKAASRWSEYASAIEPYEF